MDIVTLALAKKYADSINSGITNITTENNKLIFTLQNGNTIEIPLIDLVNNVVTEEELLNKLKDYIKNTDFASAEKAGIIKVDATSYATELDNGKLKASIKTYENYKDMNNDGFIGKGTLENVIAGKNLETANNKVTFVDEDSTDVQYPSARAMYKVSNKLDTLKDEVLDTGEASDSFIHIEDSAISELQELSIEGACEQEATDLLDMSDFEMGGMWQGESNNTYLYRINNANKPIQVVPSSEYIIDVLDWGNFKGLRFGMHSCSEDGTFINDSGWHQLKNNVPYHVTIRDDTKKIKLIFSGSTTSEIVETGSSENIDSYESAKDWLRGAKIEFKPIEGPSPNHPQEIKTITNSLNVTSCNDNIFNSFALENAVPSFIPRIESDGTIIIENVTSSNGYCDTKTTLKQLCPSLKVGDTIYFYCITDFIENNVLKAKIYLIKSKYAINNTYNTRVITQDDLDSNVVLYGGYNTTSHVKINISYRNVKSYQTHIQSQITANLPEGEFIGKIDDTYKDTLKVEYNEEDGQYHLILKKMLAKITLNGNEDISKQGQNSKGLFCYVIKLERKPKSLNYGGISNYYPYIWSWHSAVPCFYSVIETSTIVIVNTFSTLDEFKAWLSTHNTEFYYILDEPYEIDLGVVDMPLSYNEITNIFTDSSLLPQINAKYYRNFTKTIQNLQINNDTLKNELLSIENRLTALENANTTTTNTESTIESEGTE